MKTSIAIFIVFFLLNISCFAQDNKKDFFYYPNNVNYYLSYNYSCFYNVNGKSVSFPSLNFNLSLDPEKKIQTSFGFYYYFPKNYNGQLISNALYDTLNPQHTLIDAKMKGAGFAIEINLILKTRGLSYTSKSEDFMIFPHLGLNIFTHNITYDDREINYDRLSYYVSVNQETIIGSIAAGLFIRYRVANIPFFMKISHNIVFKHKSVYNNKMDKDFSSYLNIGFGLTFPINKGPGVSNIKKIKF